MNGPSKSWEEVYAVQTARIEELMRENAALRAELDRWNKSFRKEQETLYKHVTRADKAERELAALRADKARLDWLLYEGNAIAPDRTPTPWVEKREWTAGHGEDDRTVVWADDARTLERRLRRIVEAFENYAKNDTDSVELLKSITAAKEEFSR